MSKMGSFSVFAFFVIVFSLIFCWCFLECDARDRLIVGNSLIGDQTLVSAGNKFELGFFRVESGARYVGIWYHNLVPRTFVWVARRDQPLLDSCGGIRISDDDGNVEVSCSNNEVSLPITLLVGLRASNRTLQLLDSGNLVLVDAVSSARLWQSFDEPTNTFLSGMKLDNIVRLSSWISPTDPSIGHYSFGQDQGIYVILEKSLAYHWKNNEPGSFMKDTLPFFVEEFLNSETVRGDYATRLVMNYSGEIQYYSLSDGGSWSLVWSAPDDPCSEYNVCGKFGICNENGKDLCECPLGFKPVSLEDWRYRRYSEGCERVPSSCNRRRSFLSIRLVRVGGAFKPFGQAQNEEACKKMCLDECRCQAYYFKDVFRGRESDATRKCWIWMNDVENLHRESVDGDGSISLSLRFSEGKCLSCYVFF